jgi:hypothetical protein
LTVQGVDFGHSTVAIKHLEAQQFCSLLLQRDSILAKERGGHLLTTKDVLKKASLGP